MVEVTVCENGQKVLVRRGYQEKPEETYTVAITELHHDKENIGSIFEGLLYVRKLRQQNPDLEGISATDLVKIVLRRSLEHAKKA